MIKSPPDTNWGETTMALIITNIVLTLVLYFVMKQQHRYYTTEYDEYQVAGRLRRLEYLVMNSLSVRPLLMLWAMTFGLSVATVYVAWQHGKDLPL